MVGNTDDNPNTTKYMGYYRLKTGYQLREMILNAQGQYNWNTGYGRAELGTSYLITKRIRTYTQICNGYGESLTDCSFDQMCASAGLMLNNLF